MLNFYITHIISHIVLLNFFDIIEFDISTQHLDKKFQNINSSRLKSVFNSAQVKRDV